jgi:hypothetical protein
VPKATAAAAKAGTKGAKTAPAPEAAPSRFKREPRT